MKGLFKNKKSKPKTKTKTKTKTPVELVKHLRELLLYVTRNTKTACERKISQFSNSILEIRTVLFGDEDPEPNLNSCQELTSEFFREDTLRLIVICFPKLELGFRLDAIHVIANLQKQKVNSQLIACEYLEKNLDIMDILIPGYESDDDDVALTYGALARECIRHQCVAKYVLESPHIKKFFVYLQNPDFDVASDAQVTFKELLTRHRSTVAEFLSVNYEWFFQEYKSRLLETRNYITRRQAVKLLGDILLHGSNSNVRVKYLSSLENMLVLMNLLRDSSKCIQLESFHVFTMFVANESKSQEIKSVLLRNRCKLFQFVGGLDVDNEEFEADRSLVIREINALRPREQQLVLAF